MQLMRDAGYLTGATEVWCSHTRRRRDLFGFIDFVAIGKGRCVGVQCCARSGLASHRRKMTDECSDAVTEWLASGCEIELHGWDRHEVPLKSKPGVKLRRRLVVELCPRLGVFRRRD